MPDESQTGRPSLYIVDALNFLFRAFHALPPLATTHGQPTGALYGLSTMLLRIEREQKPTHLCVVFDAPGRSFRNEIYAEYKAHRPPAPPELTSQIELVHPVIEAFGITSLMVPGYEADDVIATLARLACADGLEVVICSSDKDLLQLVGDRIALLDTMKNRRLGVAEVVERFGVQPDKVGDVLALMGDSIDNVPGVPGIGPKTAAELVNRFGSLQGVLEHAGQVKGKRGEALVAAREDVLRSRELVRLREDVALPKTLQQLHRCEPDRQRLYELFRRFEFSRLVDAYAPGRDEKTAAVTNAEAAAGRSQEVPVGPSVEERTVRENAPPAIEAASPEGRGEALATPQPPAIVADAAALRSLAERIRAAGEVGVSVLDDGPSSMRCDLVGLAFAFRDGATAYVPLCHRYLGAPVSISEKDALAVLGPIFAATEIRKHTYDAKALDVLLRCRESRLAGVASDALLAAYVLDASRTHYDLDVVATSEGIIPAPDPRSTWLGTGKSARRSSEIDVADAAVRVSAEAWAALALAGRQQSALQASHLDRLYHDIELPLARVLAKVECRGVLLDVDVMRRLGHEVGGAIAALEEEIYGLAGTRFNIASNKQLADVLFVKLGLPVVRRTKTGASTDADTLEELAALHPVPAKIVEYRGLTKLKGTYIDTLPALVNPSTGRLHTSFNQAVAATGRLSSSDPNLQNIPIRTEVGRKIREAFIAPPGWQIVSADYSQIELRIVAHFSGDPAFVEAFRSGEDIHRRTAAEVFSVPSDAVTPEHRRIAKAINFGLAFGQSDFGLAQVLRIPRAKAREYIDSYFARYAGVKSYMERSIAEARAAGESTTLLGRRRRIPEINATRAQDRAYAERIARNTPIQGSAADLLKLAMIRVDQGMEQNGFDRCAHLLLTVHDELVFEVAQDRLDEFKAWVKNEMESVFSLNVPLVVDVGSGPTWGAAH